MNEPMYVRRGRQTFVAILILRLLPLVLFIGALAILAILQDPIVTSLERIAVHNPEAIAESYVYILGIGMLLFITLFCVLVLIAVLEYISFRYAITEHSFRTREGIFNIQELSIRYDQVQNIDISRPLLYRFLCMSRVEILTAGQDKNITRDPYDYDDECIIDIIDKDQADMIRNEFNSRSHVQLVQQVPTAQHMY